MIIITGDTHGSADFYKLLASKFKRLTKDDYVIICGDCGVLFNPRDAEYMVNLYSYLPFTVLFVDGNHENFDMIYSCPVEDWNGGKIHRISESVIHLMRGQVFDICGKTFFTFGGAYSFDKSHRTPGVSWWEQEMPTEVDKQEGVKNLARHNNRVDYIITHDCPVSLMDDVMKKSAKLQYEGKIIKSSNEILQWFSEKIIFDHWYFGHFHIDEDYMDKYSCLFMRTLQIC